MVLKNACVVSGRLLDLEVCSELVLGPEFKLGIGLESELELELELELESEVEFVLDLGFELEYDLDFEVWLEFELELDFGLEFEGLELGPRGSSLNQHHLSALIILS